MIVRLTDDARDDLNGFRSFMQERGDALIADTIVDRIGTTITALARFPHLGHTGHRPGTLEFLIPRLPFVIIYRVDINDRGDELAVLRIFHTSRDHA